MPDVYDLVILGAGPAGEHAAGRARRSGLSVAIVESELVGGECSYFACMPSKTLLRPGRVLAEVRAVPGAREAVTGELDTAAALARRDWITSDWHDDGRAEWLSSIGATLLRGIGRITGERRVEVVAPDAGRREVEARKAVIVATGSTPVLPPIAGLSEIGAWTNREATSAERAPRSLLVLGAGAVGVEMAQAWRRLGSQAVTIVEMADRLLPAAEPFAGRLLAEALAREGVTIRTGSALVSVCRAPDGSVRAMLADKAEIVAEELLVATGRRARLSGIGLESLGVEARRVLLTDERLRVNGVDGGWLYAIGDANGRSLLTHMGKYQARVAVDTILGKSVTALADDAAIPAVVFTDPEVAWVGLTEAAARARAFEVRTASCDLASVAASRVWGEGLAGRCQLVVDAERSTVLGATFVGPDTAELLHAATVAIVGEVRLSRLRHAVAAYPTLSEVWLELVDAAIESAES